MENIEQIRMLVTLKGERLWLQGEVLKAPFHPEILREIGRNPDLVEILKRKAPPEPSQKQTPEKVEEADKKVITSKHQLVSRRK